MADLPDAATIAVTTTTDMKGLFPLIVSLSDAIVGWSTDRESPLDLYSGSSLRPPIRQIVLTDDLRQGV